MRGLKQTAITKHPERHGSFCLRVMLTEGATVEIVSPPMAIPALIAKLEGEIVFLRRIEGEEPKVAAAAVR